MRRMTGDSAASLHCGWGGVWGMRDMILGSETNPKAWSRYRQGRARCGRGPKVIGFSHSC